jgi:hypothetical protein
MTGTETARGTASPSRTRLTAIVIGIVVLLALAAWAFSAMGRADDAGNTGPANTTAAPTQQPQTSASTAGSTQLGSAAIQLTAALGPDSRNIRVRGSGFAANEEVVLSVNGTEAKKVRTDASGGFAATLTVSFSGSTFTVRAEAGASGRSATGTVTF